MNSRVLIGIGANLGDREYYIGLALKILHENCKSLTISPFYETEPLGAADQVFLNGAAICETSLQPRQFLELIQGIESELGRKRLVKWGNRTIDLDILLWTSSAGAQLSLNEQDLTIPHPEMLNRDFVLVPSVEIASEWTHPQLNRILFDICADKKFSLESARKLTIKL